MLPAAKAIKAKQAGGAGRKVAELAGPLPPEIQQYTVFPAAIGAAAMQAEVAQALLKFLKSPDAAKVLKAEGLEPA